MDSFGSLFRTPKCSPQYWQTERIPKEIQKMKNLERKVSNVQFLVKRCVEILPRNQDQHKKIQTKNWVTK